MTERPVARRTFIAGTAGLAIAACTSSPSTERGVASTAPASTTRPAEAATAPPTFASSAPRTRPLVALTFHVSGDPALTVALLDLLRARRVVVTAFMVGTFVDANPELLSTFVRDGHELANHTYTHLTFASLSREDMISEVV